jgi:glycosyltransferase involved in cell wall biosynthesis
MKLAVLKGNRFNPWHLQGFKLLRGQPEVTAFRAESEIQNYFHQRDDGSAESHVEQIYFDTQAGNPLTRFKNTMLTRYCDREPRIVPFAERLRGYDLVHSWELFTDWSYEAARARKRWGIPLVIMVWDNIPFNGEASPERRQIKEEVIAYADRFLVYSERSRRTLDIEGVPAEKVVHINPGVDTDLFSPGESKRQDVGINDDEFVILFVGWLLPRKGIDFLLLALRELLADSALATRKIRLLMVGSGPGRDRVEALIARLGIVDACTFAGAKPYDHMPETFRAADLFVLPSIATPGWQEQFGMSLIEAMACGVPVVSTLSGAIPEIAGDCGRLCQPNDFCALHETIRELILDPAQRVELGEAGRARALEYFDLREHARALSDVYESVLSS